MKIPKCTEMQYVLDFIEENGTLIGSRAWGASTDSSDWDYVMHQTNLTKIYMTLQTKYQHIKYELMDGSMNPYESDDGDGNVNTMYFAELLKLEIAVDDGYTIQLDLFGYDHSGLEHMKTANSYMTILPNSVKSAMQKNKEVRVELFKLKLETLFGYRVY